MLLGADTPREVYRLPDGSRYYVATDGGLLWEYHPDVREVEGALTLEGGADGMSVCGDRLYVRTFSGGVFSVLTDHPGRYDRIGGRNCPERRAESGLCGSPLEKVSFDVRSSKEGNYVLIDLK